MIWIPGSVTDSKVWETYVEGAGNSSYEDFWKVSISQLVTAGRQSDLNVEAREIAFRVGLATI